MTLDVRLAGRIVEGSPDAITVLDRAGVVTYASTACADVLGRRPADVTGHPFADLVHRVDRPRVEAALTALVDHAVDMQVECRVLRGDGNVQWVEVVGRPPQASDDPVVLLTRDIADRRAYQDLLRFAAMHDPLTGLANRHLLMEELRAAVARAGRSNHGLAALYIDLDHFKRVNDVHGHEVGDLVLREAARRITECIRQGDLAGRIGGDEFVVLAFGVATAREAERVAQRLRLGLRQPCLVGGRALTTTASVGVGLWRRGEDADLLLRKADQAMYEVKSQRTPA